MGPTERRLTAAIMAITFAAGIYVVIFAPFMVNERDDGSFSITDYSFTKGINEAAILADSHCAEQGAKASGLDTVKTYKRVSKQFGTEFRFTCIME